MGPGAAPVANSRARVDLFESNQRSKPLFYRMLCRKNGIRFRAKS